MNELNVGPHLLGRIVEHDPRSRNFPAQPRKLIRPKSRLHKILPPALSQGDIGSCVGHTAAQWLNCAIAGVNRRRGTLVTPRRVAPRFNKGTYLDDDDARALYHAATGLDDTPGEWTPDDTGSSGLGGAKALQRYWFIDSYTHVFDFPTLCSVMLIQPVMAGINWYSDMFDPDKDGVVHVGGELAGGHEILLIGIDFANKRIRMRNHWTPQWGKKGDCFISFADMERLMHEEGDITVPKVIV